MFLLGIDIGTSSTKAIVMGLDGKLLSSAAVEYPVNIPCPGRAEQDPESWVSATMSTASQALVKADIDTTQVAAIGLSGQMHGLVCVDVAGRPLRPAVIWADGRSKEQVERIRVALGPERLGLLTANPLATGFMLPSWIWLRENEPEIAKKTSRLFLPKDYVRFRLTGETGSEASDASSTLLFDTIKRRWSRELLEELEIDDRLLPPLGESAQVAGRLLPEIARQMGLQAGTPVVFGGSDQACQAIGHGVIDPGTISCTIGTGGQILAPVSEPCYDSALRLHLFCHALPGRWHLEAAILSAGLSLRWLRDEVLEGYSYQELADLAAMAPAGAEGLFFLPYLAGERTPHMDPTARGAFIGLSLGHTRAHLVRALMEGVVFALRQGLELINCLGGSTDHVIASGGATNHPLWLQLQADIFNRPICRTETVEAAAVGAAILAGVGVGLYPDVPSACKAVVRLHGKVVTPNPAQTANYEEAYHRFVDFYPRLKNN